MTSWTAFGVVAAVALVSAVLVVTSRNLVRAVLWLGAALLATAGLYAMLGASFLAGVQILVYVGGVVTLLVFGAMITRRHEGIVVPAESSHRARAGFVAGAFFAVVAAAIVKTPGLETAAVHGSANPGGAAVVGRSLLHEHVLAFEAMSFLLLIAMIGAIVLARKRDPAASTPVKSAATRALSIAPVKEARP